MKAGFMVVGLMLITTPCLSATSLEFGNQPNAAFRLEGRRFAGSLGISASLSTGHIYLRPLGTPEKQTVVEIQPALTGQWFMNQEPKVQPFLEVRVDKGVPIVSGSQAEGIKHALDDWGGGVGFGFRSAVADRLNLGGAIDANFRFETFPRTPNEITGITVFRAFLQYRL